MYTIENLSFTYHERQNPALKNINLKIDKGDFLLIMGSSGSGKTTLLRLLKSVLSPKGEKKGKILFLGGDLSGIAEEIQAEKIGFAGQNPEHGIVCDKVWHELAFGLESLGVKNEEIRLRTAEIASFFGIEEWFYKNTSELSGGQKQILNIASVMVTYPSVLILDEPAGRLDPIAAGELYRILKRINSELGTTIIMSTHTADGVYEMCSKAAVIENGEVVAFGSPEETAGKLYRLKSPAFLDMPAQVMITSALEPQKAPTLLVKDAKDRLLEKAASCGVKKIGYEKIRISDFDIIAKEIHFKYEKNGCDVIDGLSLDIARGKHTAVVGGNGAGKTTLLQVLCGVRKAYRGSVKVKDGRKIALLSQNPQDIFCRDTVRQELFEMTKDEKKVRSAAEIFELGALMNSHPFDLSGGEQQIVAFAKVYLSGADILLLDEPTKGMDGRFRKKLGTLIKKLLADEKTVVTVSHDIDFCAEYADMCAMLFKGKIVTFSETHDFFDGNSFYTTAANRISKGIIDKAVTTDEVIEAFGKKCFELNEDILNKNCEISAPKVKKENEQKVLLKDNERALKSGKADLSFLWLLIAVPFTIWAGFHFFDDRRYYFISLLLVAEAIFPFFFNLEKEKPSAREVVLLSVFCAAAAAGRIAFLMVPQISALGAVVVLAGVCFGPQKGFLTGAVAMFLSNMFAGQGSWTPYQMAAMGLAGLAAGVLRRFIKGKLLPFAGGIFMLLIYGPLMNISSVLMSQPSPKLQMFIASLSMGLPFDLIHAASTFVFLALLGNFVIKKTERVIMKYDLTG